MGALGLAYLSRAAWKMGSELRCSKLTGELCVG
jgi:hypothetical protein